MSGSLKLRLRTAIVPEDEWLLLQPEARDLQIPDDALPLYLYIEGPGAELVTSEHFICRGEVTSDAPGSRRFVWKPFQHDGELAYGFLQLRLLSPNAPHGKPLDFWVEIIWRSLGIDFYSTLFSEVCRVADGLVTEWYSQKNPLLGIAFNATPTKFSAATAMAEITDEWQRFETSTRRIARSPRREFLPMRPGCPRHQYHDEEAELPTPVASADIYENRLVMLTLQRTATVISEIQNRAYRTFHAEEQRIEFFKGAHNFTRIESEARQKIAQCQKIIGESNARLCLLRQCIRALSQVRTVAALKSRVPHITPRIRMHPDYHQVLLWWRAFGQQRFVRTNAEALSALPTRRSSSIYEYWVLLALFSALEQLGYRSRMASMGDLVNDDLLDLELLRNRPIEFQSSTADETVTLWYEPQAKFYLRADNPRPLRVAEWDKFIQTSPTLSPGLYARSGPLTPDFLLELRCADRIKVAVGDAIFSEGVERPTGRPRDDVVPKKSTKVDEYVRDLLWVKSGTQAMRMHKAGLVIFCGYEKDIEALEERAGAAELLALRPLEKSTDDLEAASKAEGKQIMLPQETLDRLARFIEQLRTDV